MSPSEILGLEDHWSQLQQPARPGSAPRFRELLAALDTGWQVEEPVYLKPRWGEGTALVYHFILRRDGQGAPRLVTVPQGDEVERYLRAEGLRVTATQ